MVIGISLFVLVFSIILHELAHGFVAFLMGDDTAKEAGRLTLNPFSHIDLMGSIILPAMLMIAHMPVLGWAKPVPINPQKMRYPKNDIVLVSLVGPLVNILLVLMGFLGLKWIISQIGIDLYHTYLGLSLDVKDHILFKSHAGMDYVMLEIFLQMIFINGILAAFNLIPIPPLDGSRILIPFLPRSWEPGYAWLEKYGIVLLFLLLYLNIFSPVFRWLYEMLSRFIVSL